ncbi:MAG: Gfo/Idh/MocA family oxidoreductase [Oligoflexia bacterium]|nr:Gfo/Idh/MocA family oxidoreductase [Oligoflexia bacterium]
MIKAGIIGLGVGEAHIAGYQSHPQCKVISVCDFDQKKLVSVARKYPGLNTTQKAEDVLNDPQISVVSIASFDNFHFEQILTALKNGKHVFVEKPFVLFEHEAQQIRKILDANPQLKLSSNLILRRYPRFLELKKLLNQNELGIPYYIEADYLYGRIHKITSGWRSEIPFYSVIYGGGVHMVDLLLWLFDSKVLEVSAFGNKIATKNTAYKFNDMVSSILKFENGLVAKVTANFGCVFPHFHAVSVFGTKGTFKNGFKQGYLFKDRESQKAAIKIKTPYPGAAKGDYIYQFVESILGKKKADCIKTNEVFDAMSVCFAIEKAMQENKVVKVNYI